MRYSWPQLHIRLVVSFMKSKRPAHTWGEADVTQGVRSHSTACSVRPYCVHVRKREKNWGMQRSWSRALCRDLNPTFTRVTELHLLKGFRHQEMSVFPRSCDLLKILLKRIGCWLRPIGTPWNLVQVLNPSVLTRRGGRAMTRQWRKEKQSDLAKQWPGFSLDP
jgi:hypothetical protein